MEVVGVGKPQSMRDQPALQPIDLILVNKTWRAERETTCVFTDNVGKKYFFSILRIVVTVNHLQGFVLHPEPPQRNLE